MKEELLKYFYNENAKVMNYHYDDDGFLGEYDLTIIEIMNISITIYHEDYISSTIYNNSFPKLKYNNIEYYEIFKTYYNKYSFFNSYVNDKLKDIEEQFLNDKHKDSVINCKRTNGSCFL